MNVWTLLVLALLAGTVPTRADAPASDGLFVRSNLVAWCIVPFDAKKRGPEERAAMLESLGFKQFAYDWRDEHIPTFDAEVEAMKRHGVTITAWWFPQTLDDTGRKILDVCKRHGIAPQLWIMGGGDKTRDPTSRLARVESESARLLPIARAAAEIGAKVGLYNHGGWFGDVDNQRALIERLGRDGVTNVGIVLNLHHAHDVLEGFAIVLEKAQPHLLAVNLNGMTRDGERNGRKILPLGQGELDLEVLRVIRESGWRGPIGILNHTDADAEARLRDNLAGLDWLVPQLDGKMVGPAPKPISWVAPASPTNQPPRPAPFLCDRKPLHPDEWPDWNAFVNRERQFDFYAKEARHFLRVQPRPALLPEYPGLDSGIHGHWGNQWEDTWADDRWSKRDLTPVMCGVFRGVDLVVPKSVCVSLGTRGELSACFDPERLDFRVTWRGGFVGVGSQRSGLMEGLHLRGEVVEKFAATNDLPAGSLYHGYFRHGRRVVFAYRFGEEEILDSAWCENGVFVRQRMPAASHPLRELLKGGPAQWPQIVETRGATGTGKPYAVDTLTLPHDNPWQSLLYLGGHDFFSNGDIAVCTMQGDVWRVSGVDADLAHLRWKRMASGLHQPLGLVILDDTVCVLGRDQITRLHDLNGDGEADQYECLANGYITSAGGHDFICGLERDAQGRFYFASSKQGACRIGAGGQVEVLATGFRNPDGIGLGPDGTVTVPVSEGDWTAASAICQIKPGGYYGYPGPKTGVETLPPLVYLPRGLDNSSGGQTYVNSDRWGPLAGQMLHFSFGAGGWFLVLKETIDGQAQGAAVPMPGGFLSGAHRGRFSPKDGQLYVTGMKGWGTYTVADGCLQRVRYTGGPTQFPTAIESHDNGVLLRFPESLDRAQAGAGSNHFVQCWNYRYSSGYGSPEFSLRHPDVPGHDVLDVTSAHVLADGHSLFLEIPELQPAHQIHLHVTCDAATGRDVFLTAHKLGPAFTNFPGCRPTAKSHACEHGATSTPAAVTFVPNAWTQGPPGRVIQLSSANGMQFATKELHAKAGERISLTFSNPDVMPHNWALLTSGNLQSVGEQVNRFIADPRAVSRHYVPDIPDVLVYIDMVNPGGAFTVHFTAPAKPGDYPYICTFPGHWMIMNGVLKIEP